MNDNSKDNRNMVLYALFTIIAIGVAVVLTSFLMGCSIASAFSGEESLSYEKQKGVFMDAWGYPGRITFYERNGDERAVVISYDGDEKVETAFSYDENSVLLWPITSKTYSPICFSADERTFAVNGSTWGLIDE